MTENSRVLRAAMAEPWAITAEGLELVLSVAARENPASLDIEALEAYRAQHVPTAERMTRRGPVAVLDVRGPLFRRANIFTAISGATSYDVLRRDVQAALDDPSFRAIVLNMDTPGGEVTGVAELGDAIRAARERKPVVAYVGGAAASAGYWLAAQASEIVIAETAVLGSIGVRAVLQDTSEADRKAGRVEFISSQSPGKRAALDTDEGRARVQRTVDALADVFVAAVAKGRGVKPADVIARFGAGDVLVGAAAVAAGMADRLGSFEFVVAELAKARAPITGTLTAAASEPATLDRVRAILESPEAKGREVFARHVALNSPLSAPEAIALLKTVPAAGTMPAPGVTMTEHERWAATVQALQGKRPFPEGYVPPARTVGPQEPQHALVSVYPPAAMPAPTKPAATWGTVIDRMNGAKS